MMMRRPPGVGAFEQLHDIEGHIRIKVAGRLVGQQHQRINHQGPGHRHALLFAAGELRGEVAETMFEADLLEDLINLFADFNAPSPLDFQGEGDIFEDGAAIQQFEILEDDPQVAAQMGDVASTKLGDVAPVHENLPAGWSLGAADQFEQGRFPRSRRAGQVNEFSLGHPQGNIGEGVLFTLKRLGDVEQLDHHHSR